MLTPGAKLALAISPSISPSYYDSADACLRSRLLLPLSLPSRPSLLPLAIPLLTPTPARLRFRLMLEPTRMLAPTLTMIVV